MALLIIAAILIFVAVGILAYNLYPLFERIVQHWQQKRIARITPKLDKMFIDISVHRLVLLDIASPLVIAFIAFLLTKTPWVSLAAGFMGLIVPSIVIKKMEDARRRKFAAQLVDGLMLLSGSLKAGLSLLQAFEALVEEMPAPISQEFSLVVRENRMGVPLEDCLTKLKNRMQCEELDMIVTAVLVAREIGGDLTTIFSNLVFTIRERDRLLGRVRALCTQGRLQGKIMMFLPVVFGLGVYKIDPNFFGILMNDTQGRVLLIYAIVSEIIGIVLIGRLSKIEI